MRSRSTGAIQSCTAIGGFIATISSLIKNSASVPMAKGYIGQILWLGVLVIGENGVETFREHEKLIWGAGSTVQNFEWSGEQRTPQRAP